MRSVNDLQPENADQGFQFPGVFEISVVGKAQVGLEQRVVAILASLKLKVVAGSMHTRPSRAGNYVALNLKFDCPNREKYDAAHSALRADEAVRWTL